MNIHWQDMYSMGRYLFYIFIFFLLAASGVSAAANSKFDNSKKILPVLFVHGHGMYPGDWDYLMNYFVEHSYPREYLSAVSIKPHTARNKMAAREFISPAVDDLLKRTGSKKVNIISHSMGAVSSRWYASHIAPELVNAWISIAGSNHGTNALCKYTDVAAREMCPAYSQDVVEDTIQTDLNGTSRHKVDETPYGIGPDALDITSVAPDVRRSINYWTIRIPVDEWISPGRSATLNGAGGVPLNYELPSYFIETSPGNYLFNNQGIFSNPPDHVSILYNQKVAEFVLNLVKVANTIARP